MRWSEEALGFRATVSSCFIENIAVRLSILDD